MLKKELELELNRTKVVLDYAKNELQEKDKEIERLNNIINESAEEILKELNENHHLSYGVALAIIQKLLDYKEIRGSDNK